MKNIIITGAQGFIGKKLYKALILFYKSKKVDNFKIYQFDLNQDKDILKESIPKADIIFHLAAQTDVQKSIQDPHSDAMTNIIGTIKILKENPNAKIILTASAAAKDPKSPYGVSKLAQELYSKIIHKNVVICRLPNVFGEDGKGVITHFINAQKHIEVNGTGKQIRDFVHVDDIVNGLIKAINWKPGEYEMGSGTGQTIIKLAKATGKKILYRPRLEGEIFISKLKNTTPNWKPLINPIKFIKDKCQRQN